MIYEGNAKSAGSNYRGWFMGAFLNEESPLLQENVELKWATHKKGERRKDWSMGDEKQSISILISGKFKLIFDDREETLSQQGDFVYWGPQVPHTWEALEDSTIMTVRFVK